MSTENISAKFGVAVRLRRLSLGMSQEELADLADIHRTYVSDVERGSRNITLRSASRIAQALKLPLSQLIEAAE